MRIGNSLLNVETQLGLQLEPWTKGPPPPPARTKCDEQRLDSRGVMRCVSTVAGDCLEVYFDQHGEAQCLSRYTPEEWGAAPQIAVDPVKWCGDAIKLYESDAGVGLTDAQRAEGMRKCQAEVNGKAPIGGALAYVLAQLDVQKQKANIPLVVVPSGPKIPWTLIGAAAVGVMLYRGNR